jgi:hypothetical protein
LAASLAAKKKNFCSLFADNTEGGCFQTLWLQAAAARVYLHERL